ncbi:phosphatidylserine decarboxylase 1 [Teratosphaeriaceae sp. CCFEE 6253]|nr:phosphatidylserine decarboxylase 1 [Teratosphaeriaceae sp. CCFEE 6253]
MVILVPGSAAGDAEAESWRVRLVYEWRKKQYFRTLDIHIVSPCAIAMATRIPLRPLTHGRPARLLRPPRPHRPFHSSPHHRKESFAARTRTAWRNTRTVWRPIPIAVGIAFLGGFQIYRSNARERRKEQEEWRNRAEHPDEYETSGLRPKRRERIVPSGPWSVQIMSTIPLKALSRYWGWFNSLDIPSPLRVPGFKLYGWAFGVNFDEVAEPDLRVYRNLAEFFYRTLKPGVRPIDPDPTALVSPADGRVVQFGFIEDGEVEQVKGVTYHLDALLGTKPATKRKEGKVESNITSDPRSPQPSAERRRHGDEEGIKEDEEFAQVNGISYTLPNLLSGPTTSSKPDKHREGGRVAPPNISASDQSTPSSSSSEAAVSADLASAQRPWYSPSNSADNPTALYYCVVYLAPGDYHRFHSPVSWVVESRRHFAGELYSVSPYLVRTLPGLFTLNERVVLLGKWKYGFFSYTPVGATNVGSIVVNFDRELRTNSLLTDTRADRAAEAAQARGEQYSGFAEATYGGASAVLGGHALKKGEEMGGFQLGSTIVMVFEAPKGRRPTFDEGMGERRGGWRWNIEKGMKVQVGQKLGYVAPEDGGGGAP